MKECRPVSVSKGAFIFCKWTVAIIIWASLIFRIKWLILLACGILVLSAILKIQKAPLIFLYTQTIDRIFKSPNEILDECGMQFAHTLGGVLTLICALLLYFVNDTAGWIMVFIVAIAKTAGAMGFCTALKLYGCMSSGGCCRLTRKEND
ncbi:MAG: DUF4395 family protein [Deltaproteobacteria bacterium]